ncbi:response regulator [Psychrosphaera sp. B3R10]|uniref:response regulator n=1 Tax=unclassified Psychrosphaera TaxID=2641570 RepID=UPI001C096BE0|nr:response regulator [Psychrosphaera sp. I2R16]MBU2989794.1 response regulator [Psychrosphaera sp. B3R10]
MAKSISTRDKLNHIIIFREDNELDALAVSKILDYFQHVLVITDINKLIEQMKDLTPKVIFFSFEHIETTLQRYYSLIDDLKTTPCCEHKLVVLCKKNEEGTAFAAYNTQVIDEYLISRPLYEKTRPILLAKQLLRELGVHFTTNGRIQYQLTNLELKNELVEIIEGALDRKQAFKTELENSIIKLDSAITAAQERFEKNQKAELNLDDIKNLLSQIKSNEIRPELLELQNKALSLLNGFVKSTTSLVTKMDPNNASIDEVERVENTGDTSLEQNELKQSTAHHKVTTPPLNGEQTIDFEKRLRELQSPQKIRVLLVEDDEMSLNLSARLFKKSTFKFDYAVSGRDALNKLDNNEYDIVFLDINLPDSDGLSIAAQLTNSKSINADTSIVVLTGSHSKLTIRRAGQVGAKAYLIKPLRESTLRVALDKCGYEY